MQVNAFTINKFFKEIIDSHEECVIFMNYNIWLTYSCQNSVHEYILQNTDINNKKCKELIVFEQYDISLSDDNIFTNRKKELFDRFINKKDTRHILRQERLNKELDVEEYYIVDNYGMMLMRDIDTLKVIDSFFNHRYKDLQYESFNIWLINDEYIESTLTTYKRDKFTKGYYVLRQITNKNE